MTSWEEQTQSLCDPDTPFSFVFTLFGALSNCIDTGISKVSMVCSFVGDLEKPWEMEEIEEIEQAQFQSYLLIFVWHGGQFLALSPSTRTSLSWKRIGHGWASRFLSTSWAPSCTLIFFHSFPLAVTCFFLICVNRFEVFLLVRCLSSIFGLCVRRMPKNFKMSLRVGRFCP